MRLDNSILEKLNDKIEALDVNNVTMYSIINSLKDLYVRIIEDGYVTEDAYLNLASYVLYAGFLMED